MKLRIKGNSLRIRLSRTEISNFGKFKYLEEKTIFGSTNLVYAIEWNSEISEIMATFFDNKIKVSIPSQIAEEWTITDLVGIQNEFYTDSKNKIFILLEKDFVCLDNTFEDQSDNFPNPNAFC